MAELSAAQKLDILREFLSDYSRARDFIPLSKTEALAVVTGLDQGLEADKVRMNQYIPAAERSIIDGALSAEQAKAFKGDLLARIIRKRFVEDV